MRKLRHRVTGRQSQDAALPATNRKGLGRCDSASALGLTGGRQPALWKHWSQRTSTDGSGERLPSTRHSLLPFRTLTICVSMWTVLSPAVEICLRFIYRSFLTHLFSCRHRGVLLSATGDVNGSGSSLGNTEFTSVFRMKFISL